MASPYATVDDLDAYLGGPPPAGAQRLLARAQDLVDAILNTSSFVTDTNGNPTDAATLAAFKAACCAQVEYWIANGDELDQLNRYSSFSIEGIAATRDSSRPVGRLCDRAADALSSIASSSTFGRALTPGKPVI